MFSKKSIIFTFIITFILQTIAYGDTLPPLETKSKTIAVFKNGMGFFVREGECKLNDGWAIIDYIPSATLGTFWLSTLDKGTYIGEIIGFQEDEKVKKEVLSPDELLIANMGRKVIINSGEDKIEGIIKSFNQRDNTYSQIVIIATKDGDIALNKNYITDIKFPDGCNTGFSDIEKTKKIKFRVVKGKDKARIRMAYLEKGITWTPGYIINIKNPQKARITMTATLINDIEDLKNVNIYFVVGYPNFTYSNVLSPMTLKQTIDEFIRSLNGSQRDSGENQILSNVMTQSTTSFNIDESGLDYNYTSIPATSGTSEEDLFLYNKKEININKGERAQYPIFTANIDYKHIYEWNIPDTINLSYNNSDTNKNIEKIWHCIKLINSTSYPWTTAPSFVVSGTKPISQDTLNYTPKGSDTNLKLTISTDIKVDRREYEIERERDVKYDNYNYDLVTVQGELYIKNLKNKEILMEIKKKLTGEVIYVSHNGKILKVAEGLKGVNYNSSISWELPVKSGSVAEVKYKYKVYIAK